MAVYIKMKKLSENEETVVYQFGPNEKSLGVIEFNKSKKEFNILERVDDGLISNESYEHWVIQKIVRIIMEKNTFPENMSVEH